MRSVQIIVLFIIIQTCAGQENFRKGYIINTADDTLFGYIDFRNKEANPKFVSFKLRKKTPKIIFKPLEIKGFEVDGNRFESAIVNTELSPMTTNNLNFSGEFVIQADTGYLEALVTGPKSLYSFVNKLGNVQFYIKEDTVFTLLLYKRYLKQESFQNDLREKNFYVGQLIVYLQNCKQIQLNAQDIRYTKNHLLKLFTDYYECTRETVDFVKKKQKMIQVKPGIMAGMTITTLKFTGSESTNLRFADYNSDMGFTGGLFLHFIRQKNQQKWSLKTELTYSSYSFSGYVNDYHNAEYYKTTYTKLEYSYLKLNNLLRFSYPIKKVHVYANSGISYARVHQAENYKYEESKQYAPVKITKGPAIDNTRNYELGFLAGLGCTFKNFGLECRYEIGNGMSDHMQLKSTTNRYHLLFSYQL